MDGDVGGGVEGDAAGGDQLVDEAGQQFVRASRMGRLLRAFADAPTAVDAHGTNTNELKVLVFSISAFMAAVAGALLGPITGTAAASGADVGGLGSSRRLAERAAGRSPHGSRAAQGSRAAEADLALGAAT